MAAKIGRAYSSRKRDHIEDTVDEETSTKIKPWNVVKSRLFFAKCSVKRFCRWTRRWCRFIITIVVQHFTPVCCHRPFALSSCINSPQNLVVTASNALTSALTEHPDMDVSLGEKKTRSRWDKLVYLWEFLVWDLIYIHLMHIWGREERLKVCMFFVYCRLSMFSLVVIT